MGIHWAGYTLGVVRCVFNQHLKIANVFDSPIAVAAGNSFLMVGVEKLKESLLKLVVQYIKDSNWLSEDSTMVGIYLEGFRGMPWCLVS